MTVYATGAVQHPGVYILRAGSLVADLLAVAGGPASDADLEHINLAAHLQDAQQVSFPRLGTPGAGNVPPQAAGSPAATSRSTGKPALTGPVDINTAGATALEALPGIGPSLAARIVAYRAQHGRFARPEAIQDVPGIGPKLYDGLKDKITVGP